MIYDDLQITVYVANLKKRPERLVHIKNEFGKKKEFDVRYIEATEHEIGDIGLWDTLCKCIQMAKDAQEDVIIFCEDDHLFTENYSKDILFENIIKCGKLGADLLIGGSTGGFNLTVPVTNSLMWIDHYVSNQFLVIFSGFFDTVLNHTAFDHRKKVDNTLSSLTMNKYIFYPYISMQFNSGYSDVTKYNDDHPNSVYARFVKAEKKLELVNMVYQHIKKTEGEEP